MIGFMNENHFIIYPINLKDSFNQDKFFNWINSDVLNIFNKTTENNINLLANSIICKPIIYYKSNDINYSVQSDYEEIMKKFSSILLLI